MTSRIVAFGRRIAVLWVDGVRRWSAAVAVAAAAVTIAAAYYVVGHISINTDTEDMLSPDLPFRQESRALSRAFPQFSDDIAVVIEGQTPDLADDAAMALAAAMRKRPKVFERVFDQAGEPFFRKNGLLYLDRDELYDLSDRLAEAQPFLGTLWRDPSLRGLFQMLGRAIDETLKSEKGAPPIEIGRVLRDIAAILEAQRLGRFSRLSWQNLMTEKADKPGPYRRFILVQPVLDFGSLQPAIQAIQTIRTLAGELHLTPDQGVEVRLTGSAALAEDELKTVEQGMGLASVLSLVLVVALLFVGFRSARLVAGTIATLVMGLIWTAAFAVAAVGKLNLISVAFAVLFIGLSVDFGIHFGLRYKESVDADAPHDVALRDAAESVGGALTLCAVAAAISFFSFLPTAYLGLAELGVIAGSGMFIALFSNLTVLPALLTIMPARKTVAAVPRRPLAAGGPSRWIGRHPRAVLWLAVALAAAGAVLLPRAHFDFDPLNLRDRHTESMATLLDLMRSGDADTYSSTVLAKNINNSREISDKLDKLSEVKETRSITDYIPADQDEKLEVVQTMSLFLAPALTPGNRRSPPTMADDRRELAEVVGKLKALAARLGQVGLGNDAARLLAAIEALGGERTSDGVLGEMERRLLSGLPQRLSYLRTMLEAEPVTLGSLPAELRRNEIAADGRVRVEIFPRENLMDHSAARRFVEAVRTVAPHATGGAIIIVEAGDAVVAAFRDAGIIAVSAIAALLVVVLRNVRDVLFVFAPLLLAALLTVAASVLLDLPFNFANVIVLPLLFGLGVANGIHVVLRARHEGGGGPAVFATSTPRAVVFSALTTIGSFGSIALSKHPGTASMGVLLTIAITLTLVCTLLLLPALMAVSANRTAGDKPAPQKGG